MKIKIDSYSTADAGVCGAEMIGRECVCSRFYGRVGALRLRLQEALCKKRALASYAFCLKINTQIKACTPPTRHYSARRHVLSPACVRIIIFAPYAKRRI
jgi:hypothetical protein